MPAKKVTKQSAKKPLQSKKQDMKVQSKVDNLVNEAISHKKLGGLSAEVYDLKGAMVKSIELPKEIFGEKINEALMTQAVLVYLANQREGSAWTQGRGEVTGSTRKIYRQKGTGRARHGAITAPIFVGGGIAHGPKPHDFSKKMSKQMRKKALLSALSSKQKNGEIKVIAGLLKASGKTREIAKAVSKLRKGNLLLVISDEMENAKRGAKNLENVSFLPVKSLNTYEVLKSKLIVFAEEALNQFK